MRCFNEMNLVMMCLRLMLRASCIFVDASLCFRFTFGLQRIENVWFPKLIALIIDYLLDGQFGALLRLLFSSSFRRACRSQMHFS